MELFSTPYICIKLIIFCHSFFLLLNRNDQKVGKQVACLTIKENQSIFTDQSVVDTAK